MSKPTPRFEGVVEKGRIVMDDAKAFAGYMYTLNGKRVAVVVSRTRKVRSIPQNRLWHGVWLPIIAEDLGYIEPEEACRAVKVRLGYCQVEDDSITGGKRYSCRSTADMDSVDMAEFLTKAQILMADFNIKLPNPGEVVDE